MLISPKQNVNASVDQDMIDTQINKVNFDEVFYKELF